MSDTKFETRDSLLRKCRDHLATLEEELRNEKAAREEAVFQLQKSSRSQQSILDQLDHSRSQIEEITVENLQFKEMLSKATKVAHQLQGERDKSFRSADCKIKQLNEYILKLETELESKNRSINEWGNTVSEFEDKYSLLIEENSLHVSSFMYFGDAKERVEG